MKKLSEILKGFDKLEKEREIVDMWDESYIKDYVLKSINIEEDCIEICLAYGDYINDTGKDFDYYNM